MIIFKTITFPKNTCVALSLSFCPNFMATKVDAPTPTSEPKAAAKFIRGNVTANPAIANGPTPWPMKRLSTILYKEEAVIAIMAGIA